MKRGALEREICNRLPDKPVKTVDMAAQMRITPSCILKAFERLERLNLVKRIGDTWIKNPPIGRVR